MHDVMRDLGVMVQSQGETVGKMKSIEMFHKFEQLCVNYRKLGGQCGEGTFRGCSWQPAAGQSSAV